MEQIIIFIHVLIALAIIALILLQQGKGADMGASFGGGGSQTLFGPDGGGNVLTRATAIFATLFFVSSFGLAVLAKQKADAVGGESEFGELEAAASQQQEALPELDDLPELDLPEGQSLPTDILDGQDPIDIVDQIP